MGSAYMLTVVGYRVPSIMSQWVLVTLRVTRNPVNSRVIPSTEYMWYVWDFV